MEDKNILYVTLLAIVAIVALVALSSSSHVNSPEFVLDDEGNIVGNARYSWHTARGYRADDTTMYAQERISSGLRINSAKDTAESEGHSFVRLQR